MLLYRFNIFKIPKYLTNFLLLENTEFVFLFHEQTDLFLYIEEKTVMKETERECSDPVFVTKN